MEAHRGQDSHPGCHSCELSARPLSWLVILCMGICPSTIVEALTCKSCFDDRCRTHFQWHIAALSSSHWSKLDRLSQLHSTNKGNMSRPYQSVIHNQPLHTSSCNRGVKINSSKVIRYYSSLVGRISIRTKVPRNLSLHGFEFADAWLAFIF